MPNKPPMQADKRSGSDSLKYLGGGGILWILDIIKYYKIKLVFGEICFVFSNGVYDFGLKLPTFILFP